MANEKLLPGHVGYLRCTAFGSYWPFCAQPDPTERILGENSRRIKLAKEHGGGATLGLAAREAAAHGAGPAEVGAAEAGGAARDASDAWAEEVARRSAAQHEVSRWAHDLGYERGERASPNLPPECFEIIV